MKVETATTSLLLFFMAMSRDRGSFASVIQPRSDQNITNELCITNLRGLSVPARIRGRGRFKYILG